MEEKKTILVSACLLGIRCRYDGLHALCKSLRDLAPSFHMVPFCPEQLGGLPTPRPPVDLVGGDGEDALAGRARLITKSGEDVTAAFLRGAEEAGRLAKLFRVSLAVMKDRSPSCGLETPHCDKPSGAGIGVTAALFRARGIEMVETGPETALSAKALIEKGLNKS